jgi:hypothetical protein
MKQSTTCFRLQALPAILLLCFGCVAQQRQDIPAKQELALEVSNVPAGPWEIHAFDGGGGSAANFRRIKEWKPSREDESVNSIDFKIGREGFALDDAKKTKTGFEIAVEYGSRYFYHKRFIFICKQQKFYLSKVMVDSFDKVNPQHWWKKEIRVRPILPLEKFFIGDFMLEGVAH